MAAKESNVFSKIYNVIGAFDDLGLLEKGDTLTGSFKVKRKIKNDGISKIKATFSFKDEIVNNLGFSKVKFKDNVTNSLFGDAENPRTTNRGNKKYDYLASDGTKIVELSVEPDYLKAFESGKKLKGFFRASLDDNFIAMSTGQRDQFQDNKILTADFEIPLI